MSALEQVESFEPLHTRSNGLTNARAEPLRTTTSSSGTSTEKPYREVGALIDRAVTVAESKKAGKKLMWPRLRRTLREPFSEACGTFILVIFGDGAIAQAVLSNHANGSWVTICWGWGLGIMLGVYTAGISGAHLNPGVTLTNCFLRRFPWKKFPVYMLAQTIGAMGAAFVLYGNYKSAIDNYEGGQRTVPGYSQNASAGIFATYPAPFMTRTGMFFDEFIASTLLMFMIYAIKDDGNLGAGNMVPLALFFVFFGIAACFGYETGFAINFARDFGPRLVTYIVGYGTNVWRAGGYYFWIPMVAPFLGCAFGGFLYDLLLFTGDTPINSPWFGFDRYIPGRHRDEQKGKHTRLDSPV